MQTEFQPITDTQFMVNIPEADNINHIVIFLTGVVPLPPGLSAAVYFSWPDPNAPPSWQYLGFISNTKPSAIFKISQLKKLDELQCSIATLTMLSSQLSIFGQQPISHTAQIGISVMPETDVAQLQSPSVSLNTIYSMYDFLIILIWFRASIWQANSTSNVVQFSQKMLENFFNFASSFAITQAQMTPNPSETFVPLSTLQSWYNNFERRLQQNPNFWKH